MKNLLLNLSFVFGLLFVGGAAMAQAPSISYTGSPYTFATGTNITATPVTPTNGTGAGPITGGYSAVTLYSTPAKAPFSVATDPTTGYSYTIAGGSKALYQIVAGTATLMTTSGAVLSGGMRDIVRDGLGNFYISDNANGVIRKFTVAGTVATLVATIGTNTAGNINAPYGLTVDGSNNVYVADWQGGGAGNGVIFKIAAGSTTVTTYATGLTNPWGLAFSGTVLYVSQPGLNNIVTIASALATPAPFAGTFSTPRGLTPDGAGNIYEADFGSNSILEISAAGVVSTMISTGLSGPSKVSFDGSSPKILYEADYTGGVVNQSTQTTYYTITPANIAATTGLTFNAATGIVTGITSATASGPTTYTVTAYNSSGSSSTPLIITVAKPPVLTYNPTSYTFTAGITANTTIPIVNTGSTVTSAYAFTLTGGTLPAGLTINTATGGLQYTTATAVPGTVSYSVNGTSASGLSSATPATITITIVNPAAPTSITYPSPYPSFTFVQGAAVSETPTVSGQYPATGAFAITNTTTSTAGSGTNVPGITGLTFNANTGLIAGTVSATASLGTNNFTVTVTNAGGSATATFSITIIPPPPTIAYTGSPFTYYTSAAITTLIPTTTNSPTSYSISPNLTTNTGLSFSTTTGQISGTPTSVSGAVTYTITATNANSTSGTTTISITVLGPPTITYTGSPYSYTVGTAITSLTPAVTNNPASYSISPSINTNTGLTFSTSTGVISGTPTTASTPVTYTITATNPAGSGTTTISVQVYPKSPTIAYTGSPYTYYTSAAITTLTPTTTNSPTSYSISPNLTTNTGLSFSTTTGQISGTPTTVSGAVTYTITATNANPTSGTTTISITVLGPPTISYTGSPYTYTVGTAITSLTPAVTNNPASYSISPSINTNTGLTFSTSTGVISGNPTTASTPVTYTITATNPAGSGTTTISVQVYPKAPTVAYTGSPYTYYTSAAITTLMPTTTNSPTSYSISPNLTTNTGLSFSTTTGQISGTPTTVSGAVTYTITATNANPTSGTTTISITILGPPTISYTGSPYTYTVGTAITSLTPAVTNLPASYSISPNITTNTGLAFSTSTGVISGNPTTASTPVTYTITATNPAGSGTTTISVQVYPKAPTVAYTGSPYTYYTSAAITTLMPTTTNSPTSYSISPNLTTNTGLSFSTTTGQISGTPTTVSGAVTYTITATNANPTSGTTTISIMVVGPPTVTYTTPTAPPYTFTSGTTITPALSPTPTTSGTINTTGTIYVITNTSTGVTGTAGMPAGVIFNNTTGVINGTPSGTVASSGTYTVTVTGPGGASAPFGPFTINVVIPPAPVLSYTPANYTLTPGVATSITVTNTGGPVASPYYSISPATLPAGLTFTAATGVISGTPTTVTTPTLYTVSGTNLGGTSSAGVTIGVSSLPPAINYSPNSYTFTVGTAIPPTITPNSTNGAVGTSGLTYNSTGTVILNSLTGSGALKGPQGMATDASGNIYVVNTTGSSVSVYTTTGGIFTFATVANPIGIAFDNGGNAYVLTATSITQYSGSVATGVSFTGVTGAKAIAIDALNNIYVAQGNKVYKYSPSGGAGSVFYSGNATYPVSGGLAVDASGDVYVVDNSGGSYVDEYSPAALRLNVIYIGGNTNGFGVSVDGSGNNIYLTNTSNQKAIVYNTISATITTTETGFTLPEGVVVDKFGNFYVSDYTANTVTRFAPVSGYYLSGGPLPAGVTFNNTTGQFSGTPTAALASTTYTVTAFNASGSGSATITFVCNGLPLPVISYTPNTYVFPVNVKIPTITPNNTGGAVPTNVSYNAATQILTSAAGNGALNGPAGMATDASGNVYVVNTLGNKVTEYSATGVISSFPTVASPIGITFDSSGKAYVLTASSLTQYVGGVATGVSFTGISGATGVTIDLNNNIYVANGTSKTITEYSTTGGAGTVAVTAAVVGTNTITGGIAVDGSGNIYFGDGNNVDEYSAGAITVYVNPGTPVTALNFDGSNQLYVSGTTAGYLYLASGNYTVAFTNTEGNIVDKFGNFYVSDYSTNIVYKYSPSSGYFLSGGPLPAGLAFNNNNGRFTGTPTNTFAAITFYVTAYNSTGASNTTPITLSCSVPNNWIGKNSASSDWTTPANWSTGSVPLSTDIAYIGASSDQLYSFTVIPTIASAESVTIGTLIMGTSNANATYFAPGLNVSGTLTVTSNLTDQNDLYSTTANAPLATITGTGSITTGNLNVSSTYKLTATPAYVTTLTTSITNLTITGNLTINTVRYAIGDQYDGAFNITGGTVLLNGEVRSVHASPTGTATFTVGAVSPATTATFSVTNGSFLVNLSSNGTNIMSFQNPGSIINYSGASQSVYTDYSYPNLTTGPSYQNLVFSGTGIKTPTGTPTSNLNVNGDFTNTLVNDANDFVSLVNTVVNFTGTTQTLSGGIGSTAAAPANPGNGTVFKTVNFSGAGTKTIASGVFHVSSTGSVNLTGTATTQLAVGAGGNLCLNSDIYGSAMVTQLSGPSINGNVDVQRYLSGGSSTFRGYRMLSSPVNAGSSKISINYLIKSCYMTATTGSTAGFDGGSSPTLYLFRENLVPNNATFTGGNFRGVNNITAPPSYGIDLDSPPNYNIPVGNGYLFFFRGDRTAASYSAETITSYVPTATTLTATGALNQGSVTVNNWYTGSALLKSTISGLTSVEGYNLVGNPYASSIDWDKSTSNGGSGIVTANVNPFIYILDPVSKNYNVYKAGNGGTGNIATSNSNIIASGQGFFVVASANGATMTFNESGKSTIQVSNSNRNLFMGAPPVAAAIPTMHLVFVADSVIMDGTVINFDNNAKTQYVANVDAPHKPGFGANTLASRSADSVAMAYYTLPFPKGSQTIPLNVYAAVNGTFQLNMLPVQNIPSIYEVWLKDAYAKDSLDMKHNPTYSFTVNNSDTTTFGKNRFSLVIRQDPALMVHLLSFTATKITGGDQVVWTTENEQNYTNFVVQRSTDGGKTFNLLEGIVSSAQGTYSYLDKNPVQGANSYRLQLTDLNGTITYSNIVTIMYANTGNQIAINGMMLYPNPTSGTVNLAIDQSNTTQATANSVATTYNIQIINNLGSIIKTAVSSSPNWQTDVSTLIPGTYFIRVTNAGTNNVVGKSAFVKF